MIPVLFSKTATDFTSYGIGALSDTISCVVTEERNGLYELEMQYPTSGIHFSEIENSAIILAKPNESQNAQAFRIYQIESPIDEVCTIRAEHISYQLNHIPVDCFSATGISDAFVKLKQYSLTQNPFTFYTDKTSQSSFQNKLPKSARALLGGEAGSFLQKFKGEYLWDNWTVSLLNARGSDNGVVLRYGKNITDFNKDENYSDTVTGICPYWTNEGTVLVGDITKVNTTLPYDRVEVMDVSSDIELPDEGEGVVAPTKAQVTAAGAQELNNKSYVGVPATNITISFVALWQTEEYKDIAPLESVGLCDTVTVIYEKYGVSKKEKVIKTVYDTLLERYNEIEIGDPHYNLATSFASVIEAVEDNNDQILLEVSRRKSGDEAMSAKIDITAEQIQSTVARTQKEWDTSSYNISAYGYDTPANEGYDASDYSGQYYLNQTDGKVYYSNGISWIYWTQLISVQASLQSSIRQTADEINIEVNKKAGKSELVSLINLSTDTITMQSGYIQLQSGKLTITSGNFRLDSNGTAQAQNFYANREIRLIDNFYDISSGIDNSYITLTNSGGTRFNLRYVNPNASYNPDSITLDVHAISCTNINGYTPITSYNVGSQSVNYASSAGSAGSASSATDATNARYLKYGNDYVTISSNGNLIPSSSSVACGTSLNPFKSGYATGSWTSSDRKIKNHIKYLSEDENIEDFFMNLKPVEFTRKDETSGVHYFGFYAQDAFDSARVFNSKTNFVEAYFQGTDDVCDNPDMWEDKYLKWWLNYPSLIAPLVSIVQKQHKKIEQLEERILVLEGGK